MIRVDLESIRFSVRGIYPTVNDMLPKRMLYMNPEAIRDFYRLQRDTNYKLVYSDVFRSPLSSFKARKQKGKKVAPPGRSGHNYGRSFDIDVEKATKLLTNSDISHSERVLRLQDYLARYNWYPIGSVRDKFLKNSKSRFFKNKGVIEEWHFNHGNIDTSDWIDQRFGKIDLSVKAMQGFLIELGYNAYPVDGIYGKRTRKALNEFQRDCRLKVTRNPNDYSNFVLGAINAEYNILSGSISY